MSVTAYNQPAYLSLGRWESERVRPVSWQEAPHRHDHHSGRPSDPRSTSRPRHGQIPGANVRVRACHSLLLVFLAGRGCSTICREPDVRPSTTLASTLEISVAIGLRRKRCDSCGSPAGAEDAEGQRTNLAAFSGGGVDTVDCFAGSGRRYLTGGSTSGGSGSTCTALNSTWHSCATSATAYSRAGRGARSSSTAWSQASGSGSFAGQSFIRWR